MKVDNNSKDQTKVRHWRVEVKHVEWKGVQVSIPETCLFPLGTGGATIAKDKRGVGAAAP